MTRLLLYAVCALVTAAALAVAGTTGKIAGKVVDKASGEALPGATVVVEGTALGAVASPAGEFIIIDVPPGTYRVRTSFVGYASVTIANVVVNVNQTTALTFTLTESAIQGEAVTVTEIRPMVRKDATGSVTVISKDEIQVLPVSGFIDVLRMRAGVVGEGNDLHIRGGRGNEVAFMIDGVYVQDPLFGGLGTELHNDAIEQMEFLSGTFSAEYGNAMSGVVNLITRDGGDQVHGKVEYRTSEFAEPYKGYHERRLLTTLSGPLPMAPEVKVFLTGEFDNEGTWLPWGYSRDISTLGKLTFPVSSAVKTSAMFRYTANKHQNYNHAWKYIPWQYYQPKSASYQGMFQWTHVLSPEMFYDVKASYIYQQQHLGILDAKGNYLDTSQYMTAANWVYKSDAGNGYEFYTNALPVEFDSSSAATINVKADLVWQVHRYHEVKTGVEFKKHTLKRFYLYDPKRDHPYHDNYVKEPVEGAAYAQDKMEFSSLIVNVGLRLDYADQRAPFRSDPLRPASEVSSKAKYQVSPRIGIAHPISDRTNLHFSYGHFFQNPDYRFLYESSEYDIGVREPLFGQPNLDAQRTVAYEVGLSHQFAENIAGTFTAYYKDVTGLIGTHYYEMYNSGRFVGYTMYVNEDYANIKGFDVEFTLRRTHNISGSLTYSFQVAKGSASSETEQYPGTVESTLLYDLSFSKTHSLNANVSVVFKENDGPSIGGFLPLEKTYWNLVMRASSGYPYTPGGRDANLSFTVPNSARMPWTFSLDLEAGRDWDVAGLRLTAFIEALNLTNYKNVRSVYTDTGLPDVTLADKTMSQEYMHDPSYYGPPRRIRLGLRLAF